jgi:hypothetical protein
MALKVSQQIRQLVLTSGMSRNRICSQIELDPAIMSRFITGKGGLSMECLDRLGDLLDLRVSAGTKPRKTKDR